MWKGGIGKENWVDFSRPSLFAWFFGAKRLPFFRFRRNKNKTGEEYKDLEVSRRNVTLCLGSRRHVFFIPLFALLSATLVFSAVDRKSV